MGSAGRREENVRPRGRNAGRADSVFRQQDSAAGSLIGRLAYLVADLRCSLPFEVMTLLPKQRTYMLKRYDSRAQRTSVGLRWHSRRVGTRPRRPLACKSLIAEKPKAH